MAAAKAFWRFWLAMPALCWLAAVLLQWQLGALPGMRDLPGLLALVRQLDVFASDEVSGLCRMLAWRQDRPNSFVVPNPDSLRVYVEECVLAFQALPAEAQAQVLRLFRRPQEFRESLTFEARFFRQRAKALLQEPVGLPRKSAAELGRDARSYEEAGVWPVKERTIDVGNIKEAFQRGEVARFSVEKLGPDLLNITFREIEELDSEVAHGISMDRFYVSLPCQLLLQQWISAHVRGKPWEALLHAWTYYPKFRELCELGQPRAETMLSAVSRLQEGLPRSLGLLPVDPVQTWRGPLDVTMDGLFFNGERVGRLALTLNLRRLPHFGERLLPRLEQMMGFGGLVDRLEASLNTGATCGSFHRDLEDNVFLQLKGESHVFVYHCNVSEGLTQQDDLTSLASWLLDPRFPDRRNIPFYHVRLEAGEGVTIPSQCQHAVVSRDPRRVSVNVWLEPSYGRVSVNVWLEPSYGQLAWPGASWNHFSTMQLDHMATRFLWMRTLGRVWDRHGIRMVHAFDNFEYL